MSRSGGTTRWSIRLLKGVVLWLLTGTVLTALIAWSLAIWERPGASNMNTATIGVGGDWAFSVIPARGVGTAGCTISYGEKRPAPTWAQPTDLTFALDARQVLPNWTSTHARLIAGKIPLMEAASNFTGPGPAAAYWSGIMPVDPGFDPEYFLFEEGAGWPFICFRSLMTLGSHTSGVLPLGKRIRRLLPGMKGGAIPCNIVWPGFLLNVLILSTLAASLLHIAHYLARRRRRSRGRCPQCAYNLRGDLDAGCPECGWGRQTPDSTDSDEAPPATMLP